MAKPNGNYEIAREYIKNHPKIKHKRTLAKLMRKEMPERFTSIENARSAIRDVKGCNGDLKRKKVGKKEFFETPKKDTTPPKKEQGEIIPARILLLDIETAPLLSHVWGIWNQNINTDNIVTDWFILTWAAKWLGEDKVYSARLTKNEALAQDDKRIMQSIWRMLNEANIVITQNGEKFDIPKLNTRFLIHGMNPPLPYASIDIYKHAKKQFSFTSNKQDYISLQLGTPRKKDAGGIETWKKAYKGDAEALKKMDEYNCGDIIGLEANYLKMRAWIKPHPPVTLYILDQVERCTNCGSKELKEEGTYKTNQNIFDTLRCECCGGVVRRRKSKITTEQRRFLTISVAK